MINIFPLSSLSLYFYEYNNTYSQYDYSNENNEDVINVLN